MHPGSGGYAETARYLSAIYSLDPPIDRRQVWQWAARRTRNRAGERFPDGPPFDLESVAYWAAAGWPARWSGWGQPREQWETPRTRNARYASPSPADQARARNTQVTSGVDKNGALASHWTTGRE